MSSFYGIQQAMADSSLTGEHRLAYIGIGDNCGKATVSVISTWANVSEITAARILCDLYERGLLVDIGGVSWAPQLMEDEPPRPRKEGPTRYIPRSIREAVFSRDGRKCQYCDSRKGPFHLDHVHPLSRGGLTDPENLLVACATRNMRKGDMSFDEWLMRMADS